MTHDPSLEGVAADADDGPEKALRAANTRRVEDSPADQLTGRESGTERRDQE